MKSFVFTLTDGERITFKAFTFQGAFDYMHSNYVSLKCTICGVTWCPF